MHKEVAFVARNVDTSTEDGFTACCKGKAPEFLIIILNQCVFVAKMMNSNLSLLSLKASYAEMEVMCQP